MQRERLGLAGDAPGDDRDGAVLAEGPRRREDDAVGDAPADGRERDAPRKVWKRDAPSVQAASSWSVPTSRSTGITSRTTKGSVTKIVARTIPGVEKMIWIPFSVSQLPNQPSWP